MIASQPNDTSSLYFPFTTAPTTFVNIVHYEDDICFTTIQPNGFVKRGHCVDSESQS